MCRSVLPKYMYMYHMYAVSMDQKRHWIPILDTCQAGAGN